MARVKKVLGWLLVLFSIQAFAQQFTASQQVLIDSFNKVIMESKHDTLVATAYYNLSEVLYLSNIDTLRVLCEKSVVICENNLNKNPRGKLKYNFQKTLAGALNNIGYYYKTVGDISKGLEYYHKSLRIEELIGNKRGIAFSLNNIGGIYKTQGNTTEALEYHFKSLKIGEEIKDKKLIALLCNNIGYLYQGIDSLDLGLTYHLKSLKLSREINNKDRIGYSLNNLGSIYKQQGKISKGLEYYRNSLKIWKEIGNKKGTAKSLKNIGELYSEVEDLAMANKYAIESLELAQEAGLPILIKEASGLLSAIYKKEYKWKEALIMHELYIVMRDSIQNIETEKEIIRKQARYQIENKQQEIKLLSSKNEVQELKLNKNRILITLFSSLLGLSLVLVFFVFKSNKRKKIINKLLLKQNEAKATIIKEIHHRVKNNLHVVNSLLRRQSKDIKDEKVIDIFKMAQSRVVSMAILHEKLYNTDNIEKVSVKEHFEQLVNDLVKAYKLDTEIDIEFNIASLSLNMDVLVPLGLIINELISNSLKYAFKDQEDGVIYLKLKKTLNESVVIIIGDNGSGIETNYNPESDQMGTKLIQTFVRQLNGTIKLLDRPGTFFELEFSV
ncbi:MAG: tetratricopeptide repeat protein [Flavobacteriaceae bacterium]|nr:tetratricopeptide repeat protein [Flavobacteriaceae bacterium]